MAFSRLIVRRGAGRLFLDQINENFKRLFASMRVAIAENEVFKTYGDVVSVEQKGKSLNKFGRNDNVDTGQKCVIAQFLGASQYEETYVFANTIDRIVSSSGSDTQTVTLEGHTVNTGTGDYTFVVQDVTLTGQTPVTLGTALARSSRLFIKPSGTLGSPQSLFAGNLSVYDSSATTVTSGVPNTPAGVHLYVPLGQAQSRKCVTTISSVDYWFLAELEVSIRSGSPATKVEFRIERRDAANGGQWRPFGAEISLDNSAGTAFQITFDPLLIVPPNHDVRVTATTTASNASVTADLQGYLAIIV